MTTSDQIDKLAEALAKAQGQISGAIKDSTNPFFKSKYADLASVMDACRIPLSVNGLAIVQAARSSPGGVEVETMLIHSSGQWIKESLHLPVVKPDAQGIGSAITYARRYGLAAMVGICPEDDDGNSAVNRGRDNSEHNQHQYRSTAEVEANRGIAKPMARQSSAMTAPALLAQHGIILNPEGMTTDRLNTEVMGKFKAIPKDIAGRGQAWAMIVEFAREHHNLFDGQALMFVQQPVGL